ncbi:MAG: alcohol dehydrogenase catalytic domain-containing protein [Planctomycetaceae bacterium]|nr:alcohol dehydrogenase catalytic domain-containing protein [Planctomycetaceae bacterium]
MKAAFLTGIRQMEVREAPVPVIAGEHDVLLAVDTVGVCGSDVHYYNEGRIGSMVVEYPCMTGHECSGVVAQVGRGVTNVKPGDRVAIDPLIVCGRCDQCLSGRRHTCRNQHFLACPGQGPGALAEYLVMPDYCCYPLPAGVDLVQAALCEPLSVGVYAHRLSTLPAAAVAPRAAAVLGCGPIGLSVLAAIRAAGAPVKVYMTDLLDERLAFAGRFGADWTGNARTGDVIEQIARLQPHGLDVVFECSGEQDAIDAGVRMLKPGGQLVLIGIPKVDRVSLVIDLARRKELTVQNVRRQNECVQAAIDLVASGRVNVTPMATHHFPLDRVKEAFDLVQNYRDGVIKAMVRVK